MKYNGGNQMKYNGIELKEITEPQIFDPPKKMLVWDCIASDSSSAVILEKNVFGIIKTKDGYARAIVDAENFTGVTVYMHCAEIPEAPKPRRATNRELARWLAQGNGQVQDSSALFCIFSSINYGSSCDDDLVLDIYKVRKWEDDDWHEPTADYLGLEGEN